MQCRVGQVGLVWSMWKSLLKSYGGLIKQLSTNHPAIKELQEVIDRLTERIATGEASLEAFSSATLDQLASVKSNV